VMHGARRQLARVNLLPKPVVPAPAPAPAEPSESDFEAWAHRVRSGDLTEDQFVRLVLAQG
jgi:hypothetical protein